MKNYRLIDKTPEGLRCGVGACPRIYQLNECIIGNCPTIYEFDECVIGACPTVRGIDGKYIVIGKKVDVNKLKELGLENRVGKDEAAVEVPKGLIDKIRV